MREFTYNTNHDDNCFARFEGSPYTARWTAGERVASVFFGVGDPVGKIESPREFTKQDMSEALLEFSTQLSASEYIVSEDKTSLTPVVVTID